MIKLITDHPEYANDIAEEIRLFYSNTEVDIVSSDDTLRDGDVIISVFLKSDGESGFRMRIIAAYTERVSKTTTTVTQCLR